ncbi:MAG: peptide chain release factor N(5)-glutamine methyltransferase [Lachnospiraceae bacterium]|nr:peptide chain release factor N(5)-glutamine methyltransferase [Lachnospiraceae bacterium]
MPPDATLRQILQWGTIQLEKGDVPDASLDAWYLLEHVTGLTRADYFLRQDEVCSEVCCSRFAEVIRKRADRIPLQHIIGVQEFMGLPFRVSEHVLIPRQDTECLVELVIPIVEGNRVLDLCTGSGCIGISLAKLGKPVIVHGVDISEEALSVARENADVLQAEITFWQSDLFENVTEIYDVIVSNPPYIPPDVIESLMPEVKMHEPRMALYGGMDGLDFYRRIATEAEKVFGNEGSIFLEIGCEQGDDVKNIFTLAGYHNVQIHQDLTGKDRVVQAYYCR